MNIIDFKWPNYEDNWKSFNELTEQEKQIASEIVILKKIGVQDWLFNVFENYCDIKEKIKIEVY